jgi:3-methyladenine DNA glycosylase AlkD
MDIIYKVRQALIESSDAATRMGSQHYFKEKVVVYGVKTSRVTDISKEIFKETTGLTKEEIYNLCEMLWESGYLEETFVAANWACKLKRHYVPEDFTVFKRWIELYVNNWASCDSFCNHTMGEFVMKFPLFLDELMDMALSKNRWMRRAAAVSLIVPARRGMFLNEIFEIADIMLMDKDDMVQKGYGWMLKAASEKHQKEVFEFVMSRKSVMPRTALRYAIEKMPEEMKQTAMLK